MLKNFRIVVIAAALLALACEAEAAPTRSGASVRVRLATTADHALTGLAAIDGVTPVANNLVLVKSQSTATQNGIYVAAAGAWSRVLTAKGGHALKPGLLVTVLEGTANAATAWFCSNDAITVGATSISFVQFDQKALRSDLSSTVASKGASLLGVEDIAGKITATTVEGALAEIAADNWVTTTRIAEGTIADADVSASAALARSKIAAGTAHGAVINDASGVLSSIAPGTAGNVLKSNGTSWTSATGGVSLLLFGLSSTGVPMSGAVHFLWPGSSDSPTATDEPKIRLPAAMTVHDMQVRCRVGPTMAGGVSSSLDFALRKNGVSQGASVHKFVDHLSIAGNAFTATPVAFAVGDDLSVSMVPDSNVSTAAEDCIVALVISPT